MGISQKKASVDLLSRGVSEVLPDRQGLEKIMRRRKIRLYLGIDPTGSRLHLGHAIPLRKLQQFADLGHEAFLVVGTGTVLAGDPSQREKARPKINQEEIKSNIKTWRKQALKVVDFSKVKMAYNGKWLNKLKLKDIIEIASYISAAQLFRRDMFQKRLAKGDTVWMHETLYPLLQAYDSVFLKTDLEIGGSDQKFNMLIGRQLCAKMLNRKKFVLTVPMIKGLDGKPMSKTSGNCVWLQDSPQEMYGKIMSLRDELIISYFDLCTNRPLKDILKLKLDLKAGKINPLPAKKELAFEIVKIYHGSQKAQRAAKEFEKVFARKEAPSVMLEILFEEKTMPLAEILTRSGMVKSKSEAKRIVEQGGVKIGRVVQKNWGKKIKIKNGMLLQVGRRKFVKILSPA